RPGPSSPGSAMRARRIHMRFTRSSVACVLVGSAMSIGVSVAHAQGGLPGSIAVAAEVGPRTNTSTLDPLAYGKFEEYRDMRARNGTSALFEQLLLKFTPSDSFSTYALSARKLFDRDQSMWLLV